MRWQPAIKDRDLLNMILSGVTVYIYLRVHIRHTSPSSDTPLDCLWIHFRLSIGVLLASKLTSPFHLLSVPPGATFGSSGFLSINAVYRLLGITLSHPWCILYLFQATVYSR